MAIVRDYYRVTLPTDLADSVAELAEYAINEARERARLYCIPAEWTATAVHGTMENWSIEFRVCRKRNKP